jgi:hypothetical protein
MIIQQKPYMLEPKTQAFIDALDARGRINARVIGLVMSIGLVTSRTVVRP